MPDREPHDGELDTAEAAGHGAAETARQGTAGTGGQVAGEAARQGTAGTGGQVAGEAARQGTAGTGGQVAGEAARQGTAGTGGQVAGEAARQGAAEAAGGRSPAGTAAGAYLQAPRPPYPQPGPPAGTAGRPRPSISAKSALITAAAIVAAIIAAVAAFFVLRPDAPERQTAAQQSQTIANPPPGAATPAEGPGSSTGWSGEYQTTSYEKISECAVGPAVDTLSVSVTGAAIAIVVTGPYGQSTVNGTMTSQDTFAFSLGEGNFARSGNVATLNLTFTHGQRGTCTYRYTATRL